jgi:hypothetical protein
VNPLRLVVLCVALVVMASPLALVAWFGIPHAGFVVTFAVGLLTGVAVSTIAVLRTVREVL